MVAVISTYRFVNHFQLYKQMILILFHVIELFKCHIVILSPSCPVILNILYVIVSNYYTLLSCQSVIILYCRRSPILSHYYIVTVRSYCHTMILSPTCHSVTLLYCHRTVIVSYYYTVTVLYVIVSNYDTVTVLS